MPDSVAIAVVDLLPERGETLTYLNVQGRRRTFRVSDTDGRPHARPEDLLSGDPNRIAGTRWMCTQVRPSRWEWSISGSVVFLARNSMASYLRLMVDPDLRTLVLRGDQEVSRDGRLSNDFWRSLESLATDGAPTGADRVDADVEGKPAHAEQLVASNGHEDPSSESQEPTEVADPFQMSEQDEERYGLRRLRPEQAEFRRAVLRRYEPRCAVCDFDVSELLEAAHIVPLAARCDAGVPINDPRNGLPFCGIHHRAFDAGLFSFVPFRLSVLCHEEGIDAGRLRITRHDLNHLVNKPHPGAIAWRAGHSAPGPEGGAFPGA